MKKFLLRIFALIGGTSVWIATSFALTFLNRADLNVLPLYVTIPMALMGWWVLSQVYPRQFVMHAIIFLIIFFISDVIQTGDMRSSRKTKTKTHIKLPVSVIYILGWGGLFISGLALPVTMETSIITMLSLVMVVMPPFALGTHERLTF